MSKMTRRSFVRRTAMAAAGAGVASTVATSTWAQSKGANDEIRVGVIGIRGQGNGHIDRFKKIKGVRVVAICDVDADVLAERKEGHFTSKKQKVETYTDVRKLLENKDIDAVSTASPNHWHALISVWACQAGKDMYVEKPCSHNVWEGRKIVEAADKYNRIVQIGTQSRSDLGIREAVQYIRSGALGKIKVVRGLCYKRRKSIRKVKGPQQPPKNLDYDLWTGPAPMKPLMRRNLHYDWHWVFDTGNGDIGNQGIHQMDIARYFLGSESYPKRIMSVGGRLGYDDDGNTPNTQFTFMDYPEAPMIFEVRGLPVSPRVDSMPHYKGIRVGNVVECEDGFVSCGGGGAKAYDNDGKVIKSFEARGGGDHQPNFIKAVRSRKVSDLNAPILGGHISSALCHLGNISHQLGTLSSQDEINERIQGMPDAVNSYERFLKHLRKNRVDMDATPATLGPWLNFDAKTEKFAGNDDKQMELVANSMLTRNYREPYVVPDKV